MATSPRRSGTSSARVLPRRLSLSFAYSGPLSLMHSQSGSTAGTGATAGSGIWRSDIEGGFHTPGPRIGASTGGAETRTSTRVQVPGWVRPSQGKCHLSSVPTGTRPSMIRLLILTHRYLGVAVGLAVTLWCLSGFVMMYVPYPELMPEERLAGLEPSSWSAAAGCRNTSEATPSSASRSRCSPDAPRCGSSTVDSMSSTWRAARRLDRSTSGKRGPSPVPPQGPSAWRAPRNCAACSRGISGPWPRRTILIAPVPLCHGRSGRNGVLRLEHDG